MERARCENKRDHGEKHNGNYKDDYIVAAEEAKNQFDPSRLQYTCLFCPLLVISKTPLIRFKITSERKLKLAYFSKCKIST